MMNETGDAMKNVDPSPFQKAHHHQNFHHCHHIEGYDKARQWLDKLLLVNLRSTELCNIPQYDDSDDDFDDDKPVEKDSDQHPS